MDERSWKIPMFFGLFLILLGLYFIFSLNIAQGGGILWFGLISIVYGNWIWRNDSEDNSEDELAIEGEKQFRIKGHKVSVPWENSDLPPENEISVFEKYGTKVPAHEKQEFKIYSDILMKSVRKCCYQSARLNDKYCVCGRALEYPAQI